jgi:hypothetical protein
VIVFSNIGIEEKERSWAVIHCVEGVWINKQLQLGLENGSFFVVSTC